MRLLVTFFINLALKRWKILLMIIIFITIPLLLIQYAMLKEQSLTANSGWYIFNERNIMNDAIISDKYGDNQHQKMYDKLRRPADYCNLPLARFYEDEKALGKSWRLKNVIIFLRHGQRASSDPMTNAPYEYHINCSLKQFPLFKKHDWKRFIDTLNKSNASFKNLESYARCSENQMTLFGILQMFMLGSRLRKAYEKFLDFNLVSIFSTPYQRSILSAEILQHFLVKDILDFKFSNINESPSLLFCRPSRNMSCQCPSLRYYYAKYYRHQNYHSILNSKCTQLVQHYNSLLFQEYTVSEITMLSLSSLFDIISSAVCASNLEEISNTNAFCWPTRKGTINQELWGYLYKYADIDENSSINLNRAKKKDFKKGHRCFPLKLIIGLWQCYDENTASVNTYPDYRKYAKLASYPILQDIISKVYKVDEDVSNNTERSSKFLLYVGHDHTIRFLLGSLNYNTITNETIRDVLNRWPGFASRLVIEVFENVLQKNASNSNLKFRLLYNGLDITSSLIFCGTGNNGCDFHLFKQYIMSTGFWEPYLFASTSYSHECNHV